METGVYGDWTVWEVGLSTLKADTQTFQEKLTFLYTASMHGFQFVP